MTAFWGYLLEVEMFNFFTMNDGGKLSLSILGDHCLKYRPVGWYFDVVEVRDRQQVCIDVFGIR